MLRLLFTFAVISYCAAASPAAPVRVALMDFSTDENSYRSIQSAAILSDMVQIKLQDESEVEWLERAKIKLAKQELNLAAAGKTSDDSPVRRGRMLGADWAITGHFSTDSQSNLNFSVQIIELKYADVIVNETFAFQLKRGEGSVFEESRMHRSADAVRRALAKGQVLRRQATNQTRIAMLFLANVGDDPFHNSVDTLPREFNAALERAVATNGRLRLIHFPKAYQSTEESEMVMDGLIEAGRDLWKRTADLYVWGTYAAVNVRRTNVFETRLTTVMNLWDGITTPVVISNSVPIPSRDTLPAARANLLINQAVAEILANARPQPTEKDSTAVRRQIADSIVQTYLKKNRGLGGGAELDISGVRMLEAACFFNPDSAEARLLWLTCRYGWWVDFGFEVKNQFWTKWRRSQAWREYVDRFGLGATKVSLPFPFNRQGLQPAYIGSLRDVIAMFPQWHSKKEIALEDKWRRNGTHTWLVEAERHGFPTDMSHELAFKWRTDLEAELAQREKIVADYTRTNASSRSVATNLSAPQSNQTRLAPSTRPNQPTGLQPAPTRGPQVVPTPDWIKSYMSILHMFRLYPTNAPTHELKPEAGNIEFPPQFEVKVVKQMTWYKERLWILARDERSALSSSSKPEISGETKVEQHRVWQLDAEGMHPELYQSKELTGSPSSFLFQNNQLWLAGWPVQKLDLQNQSAKTYGLTDGLNFNQVEAIGVCGVHIYAMGEPLKLSRFDVNTSRWQDQSLPRGSFSSGTGIQPLLAGNDRWLGLSSGATWFHDTTTGSWTNIEVTGAHAMLADGSVFWIATDDGLCRFDSQKKSVERWKCPSFIESPMLDLIGVGFFPSNPTIPKTALDTVETQVQNRLQRIKNEHQRARDVRKRGAVDPFHFTSRIPGRATALANDGDFLWVGVGNYFGDCLLLIHKPSLSVVARRTMETRDHVASLAVSDTYIWAGTAYGDHGIIRLPKAPFLSVPREHWTSLTITLAERERIVRSLSQKDQALYAFLAGDDARVVQLLGEVDAAKADLEEMFILAWSCESPGINDFLRARTLYENISARFPDSPWAKAAQESFAADEERYKIHRHDSAVLAAYDRNHDGKIDEKERIFMEKHPAYQQTQKEFQADQLDSQLKEIIKRFDRNDDGKLNSEELTNLKSTVSVYAEAPANLVQGKKVIVAPLVTKSFPSVNDLLKKFDANRNGSLEQNELKAVALSIKR